MISYSTPAHRRPVIRHFRSLRGLSENLHRARKTPSFPLQSRHWPRPHHHVRKFLNTSITTTIPILTFFIITRDYWVFSVPLFSSNVLAFSPLIWPNSRQKRRRSAIPTQMRGRFLSFFLAREASEQKRNSDRSRSPKRRLLVNKLGDAAATDTYATAGGGRRGEKWKWRGRGGGRRRRRSGGGTRARAHVSAVRAEGDETVTEAGRTNTVSATLRRVFRTFPHVFCFRINRHWQNFLSPPNGFAV